MNRVVLALFVICVLTVLILPGGQAWAANQQAEWTFMVFMNADNNLDEFGIYDFLEMAKVGSTDKVNILVQFDRVPLGDDRTQNTDHEKYGDWDKTFRFLIKKGMEPTEDNKLPGFDKEVNMGDGAALEDFITWSIRTYPAKRYMLVIWNHGQGWRAPMKPEDMHPGGGVKSVSHDSTDNDILYNREVELAVRKALKSVGIERLDVLGFDACLMAMVETAYAMRGIADVMVASEENEPGHGWDYTPVLKELTSNPKMNSIQLSHILVENYKNKYQSDQPTTTLSAVKLDKSPMEIAEAADQFARVLMNDATKQDVKKARSKCKSFAKNSLIANGIDLTHFCKKLIEVTQDDAVKKSAAKVMSLIDNAVIFNYAGNEALASPYGSSGLAIYFPKTKEAFNRDPNKDGYLEKGQIEYPVEFVQKYQWDNFIRWYLGVDQN